MRTSYDRTVSSRAKRLCVSAHSRTLPWDASGRRRFHVTRTVGRPYSTGIRRPTARFVYSVRSTGVYCRPTCPAKLARRENVRFHATCEDAQRAGFRACKRCTPNEASPSQRRAAAVAFACRLMDEAGEALNLASLADSAGMSVYHFHRVFKAHIGLTPRAYAAGLRARRVQNELSQRGKITESIYRAGFNSSSRFYESAAKLLGMTPKAFRAGGLGTSIRFALSDCWLGFILVAATEKGVCAILLGDDPDELARASNAISKRAATSPRV